MSFPLPGGPGRSNQGAGARAPPGTSLDWGAGGPGGPRPTLSPGCRGRVGASILSARPTEAAARAAVYHLFHTQAPATGPFYFGSPYGTGQVIMVGPEGAPTMGTGNCPACLVGINYKLPITWCITWRITWCKYVSRDRATCLGYPSLHSTEKFFCGYESDFTCICMRTVLHCLHINNCVYYKRCSLLWVRNYGSVILSGNNWLKRPLSIGRYSWLSIAFLWCGNCVAEFRTGLPAN